MSDQVGFAGQISPEHIAQVIEKGFKSVINNRPDFEGGMINRRVRKWKKLHVQQV